MQRLAALALCALAAQALQRPPKLHRYITVRSADSIKAAISPVEREPRSLAQRARTLWRFTRPHTFVGTAVAVPALHAYAAPTLGACLSPGCAASVATALTPALLMNVFITGLNQLCDIDIDRVNKPHLPVASGELSERDAWATVLGCLGAAFVLGLRGSAPLRLVLAGSALLGFAYSAPPLRLKRSPILAALSIVAVRGVLVNWCFYAHAARHLGLARPAAAARLPWVTAFFSAFGVAIALLKDVPDTAGDEAFGIRTFSRGAGRRRVFGLASGLLS
eukprot:CAMPEP_0119259920 /NCGR_PEP_ID=MMETSP1329-20130426/548_1 /TAXON_ID=114041 /ORGANISM="Genus nov. species nov., Strain RCC1024" /LENGTH=277 /DNA_ID=CAMNT_0007259329 /DNA_START=76 /DNA_END=906 /DNA_ORIENTATION=+